MRQVAACECPRDNGLTANQDHRQQRVKKILVIDDEEWLREMVRMALSQRGFLVEEAENGAVGIQLARQNLPDLILCDVNMAKVDGYLTLSELRNDPSTASIPFILMTGLADNAGMRHGMELGADDYLPKPFTLDALYAAVEARLRKANAVRQQAEQKLADLRDSISMMLPHELRTPLNGILAYGEVLSTDAQSLQPAEVAEMGQVIYQSAKRLQKLVENVLIYAQIELLATDSHKVLGLRQKSCPAPATQIELRAREQARAAQREHDLFLDLAPVPLMMSEEYLARVVDELVQNAFKFSSAGSRVDVQLSATSHGTALTVIDRGRGFSTEHITKIGAYMQFERTMHEQQGLGLGLTIAKRLAELHGGSLMIDNTDRSKTVVTVRIPSATN